MNEFLSLSGTATYCLRTITIGDTRLEDLQHFYPLKEEKNPNNTQHTGLSQLCMKNITKSISTKTSAITIIPKSIGLFFYLYIL